MCRKRIYDLLRRDGSDKIRLGESQGRISTKHPNSNPTSTSTSTIANPLPRGAAAGDENDDVVHPDPGIDVDAVLDNQALVDTLDALQALGVDILDACRYVKAIRKPEVPTFVEVYGQGRIVDASRTSRRSLNIKRLDALDLRTGWDFTKPKDRLKALRLINERKPTWIIGSPPCVAFSSLNHGLNFRKMDPEKVKHMVNEGRMHLRFTVQVYSLQLRSGRFCLHEHPTYAQSWKDPRVTTLLNHPDVSTAISDQCEYCLVEPGEDGQPTPAKKPTQWMSNSSIMLARLRKRCSGTHKHQPLLANRAKDAAFYSLELITEILRGIRDHADQHINRDDPEATLVNTIAMLHNKLDADEKRKQLISPNIKTQFQQRDLVHAMQDAQCDVKWVDGEKQTIKLGGHFKPSYNDEYTGEVLDSTLVQAALLDEIKYYNNLVWELATPEQAQQDSDATIVGGRFVNCNKGDTENPKVRCRYVATEINRDGTADPNFYAATPPLEAIRLLCSQFAHQRKGNEKLKLSIIDATKAYFNATPKRSIYVKVPREMGMAAGTLGKLVRCAYGTRDAGPLWEDTYAAVLTDAGFVRGKASPTCFFHPTRRISVVCHGDDFVALATAENIAWYQSVLEKHFELGSKQVLGEDAGDEQEARILNRVLRLTPQGLRWEADPRHVENLARSLDLVHCGRISTTGHKPTIEHNSVEEEEEEEHVPDSVKIPSQNSTQISTREPSPRCGLPQARQHAPPASQADGAWAVDASIDQSQPQKSTPSGEHDRPPAQTAAVNAAMPRPLDPETDCTKTSTNTTPLHANSNTTTRQNRDGALRSCLKTAASTSKSHRVRFSTKVAFRKVPRPYSCMFGRPPASFVLTGPVGSLKYRAVPRHHDPYTGQAREQTMREMQAYLNKRDGSKIQDILSATLLDGAAWEMSAAESIDRFVAAVGKRPKAFKSKRLGTKAVKAHEQFACMSEVLNEHQATSYRALAARANYLALDRPDIAFAAKELCRQFAKPTRQAFLNLKHLVRYLVHQPRLAWQFNYEDNPREMTTFVDTDFAGCVETRRSTSGGAVVLGTHLLRHWATTQSTIALSSGEAELTGLVKGASHSIGMQSPARDLGFDLGIHVKSDATAAIGICRRRGLGKIRHLSTADLWIQ